MLFVFSLSLMFLSAVPRNLATRLNLIPEVKPLDDVNVLLSVDETSAVARPPGSLEAVVFFPQSEMVPLGRRQQRGDVVRASIVLAKSSPPPSSMTSWARATSLASWRR